MESAHSLAITQSQDKADENTYEDDGSVNDLDPISDSDK